MTRGVLRPVVVVTAAAAMLATASVAFAEPGPAFGQHVVQCAQTVGFSGTHNPGMHHGAAGWDGMTCAG
ncbi:MAG TPA: hypothetical protein VGJ54_00745 [Streptosporangiaceae bacterium]